MARERKRPGCMVLLALAGGCGSVALGASVYKHRVERMERTWRDARPSLYLAEEELEAMRTMRLAWDEEVLAAKLAHEEAERRRREQQGLEICNRSSEPVVWAAYVVWDEADRAWVSHGWYKVRSGECRKVRSDALGPTVYLHAHAAGGTWAGDYRACTRDDAFEIEDAFSGSCWDGEKQGFYKGTTSDGGYSWGLRD